MKREGKGKVKPHMHTKAKVKVEAKAKNLVNTKSPSRSKEYRSKLAQGRLTEQLDIETFIKK